MHLARIHIWNCFVLKNRGVLSLGASLPHVFVYIATGRCFSVLQLGEHSGRGQTQPRLTPGCPSPTYAERDAMHLVTASSKQVSLAVPKPRNLVWVLVRAVSSLVRR